MSTSEITARADDGNSGTVEDVLDVEDDADAAPAASEMTLTLLPWASAMYISPLEGS